MGPTKEPVEQSVELKRTSHPGDSMLCSCGTEGRVSVFDYGVGAFLYLCSTHYRAWTVDRVSAQLPRARWEWAESSATVREHARRDNVHSRGMRDHWYWRKHAG